MGRMLESAIEDKVLGVVASMNGISVSEFEFYDRAGFNSSICEGALISLRDKGKIRYKKIRTDSPNILDRFQIEASIIIDTEYRIVGRFRNSEEIHLVAYDPYWSSSDALDKLNEIKEKNIVDENYPQSYDLLDLRIQSREITKWSDID